MAFKCTELKGLGGGQRSEEEMLKAEMGTKVMTPNKDTTHTCKMKSSAFQFKASPSPQH